MSTRINEGGAMFRVVIDFGTSVMDAYFEYLVSARRFAYDNRGKVLLKERVLYDYSA